MANVYLDREGADGCVSNINTQIEALITAATAISTEMVNLQEYWQGASADKAQTTYDTEYKSMIEKDIPTAVDEFKQFIDGCVQAIYDTDQQLSGN